MHRKLEQLTSLKPGMIHAVGAAVALIVTTGFYQGIYAPWGRDAEERTERIAQIRELSTNAEQVAADHVRLVERLEALQQAVSRTRRRMPKEASAEDFVGRAADLAEGFGLEVQQSQTGMPRHHPTHSTVEVSYVLLGSYASMCRYLAAIDQLSQLTRVVRFDVERSPDSSAYPVQVTFQLYYQSQPLDKDEQRGTL